MAKRYDYGIVVFFEPNYAEGTIKETGRTRVLLFNEALDVYANTPNPASQLLMFSSKEEQKKVEAELEINIKDRNWLNELFECI